MRSCSRSRHAGGARAANTPPRRGWLAAAFAMALATAAACTQVDVQETPVRWSDAQTACNPTDTTSSGGTGGGRNGAGNQSPSQPAAQSSATGMMDTYVVQIFELNSPASPGPDDCKTCIGTNRSNCFIEKSTCVCGHSTPASAQGMEDMLKGVQIGLPITYHSFYCLRVMAVERTSDSEDCECDATWEDPARVRLCSLSTAYAASPLPITMDVCGPDTNLFATCVNPS